MKISLIKVVAILVATCSLGGGVVPTLTVNAKVLDYIPADKVERYHIDRCSHVYKRVNRPTSHDRDVRGSGNRVYRRGVAGTGSVGSNSRFDKN